MRCRPRPHRRAVRATCAASPRSRPLRLLVQRRTNDQSSSAERSRRTAPRPRAQHGRARLRLGPREVPRDLAAPGRAATPARARPRVADPFVGTSSPVPGQLPPNSRRSSTMGSVWRRSNSGEGPSRCAAAATRPAAGDRVGAPGGLAGPRGHRPCARPVVDEGGAGRPRGPRGGPGSGAAVGPARVGGRAAYAGRREEPLFDLGCAPPDPGRISTSVHRPGRSPARAWPR